MSRLELQTLYLVVHTQNSVSLVDIQLIALALGSSINA